MILLFIVLALLVVGIVGLICLDEFSGMHLVATLTVGVSGILLFIILIFIPINRYEVKSNINALQAFRETVESARAREIDPLERAAILKDIAKWNEEIARAKYNNKHMWDLWIPDEVESIQPLK